MQTRPFTLDLGTIDPSTIGQAVFFALLGSGWALYASSMLAMSARGMDIKKMSDRERANHAVESFRYIIQWIPDEHPFRKEVERYIMEALPTAPQITQLPNPDPPWPF
jgi:hypothetical protein